MNKRKNPSANLETKRTIFLEIGFILVLAGVLYAFELKSYDRILDITKYHSSYYEEDVLPPLVLKEKEKLPEKPIPKTILNIVDDETEPEVEIEIDANDIPDEPNLFWEPPVEEPEEIEEDIVYNLGSVKIWPEFPGGETAMYRFLGENFTIPRLDKEVGNQGKIYVQFIIDREGNVRDASILRGLSATADQEALRVVNMMPQWKPAQQGIKKVSVQYILPIHVKLM
jgi:protein TonB